MKHKLLKLKGVNEQTFVNGSPVEMTLKEIGELPFITTDNKFSNEGYVFGEVDNNYRNDKNMINRTLFPIDIDDAPNDIFDELVDGLKAKGINAVVHTSYNHKLKGNRYRVIAETSRTMTPEEYPNALPNFIEDVPVLKKYKEYIDQCIKVKSQYFLAPSHPPNMERFARKEYMNNGTPYIPDTQKQVTHNIPSGSQLTKQPINELLKGSVEGTRHNDCIRISGMLFNKGMPLQDVIQFMLGWNTKCIPPRVDKEVIDEVENIYSKYHSDNPFTAEETVIASEAEDIEFKFLGREDRENLPSVDWYIDRLFRHKGIGSIIGQERNGKSFVAIDLACRISRGMDFFGHETRGMKPVLYVPLEDWSGINLRIKGWEKYHGVEANVILLPEDTSLGFLDRGMKGINKFIGDCKKQGFSDGVIIFDTLQYLIEGMDENGAKDMGLATGYFKHMSKTLNSFIIYVHHIGKDKAKGSRGSSVLNASLDTRISVHNNHDIKIEKVKGAKDNINYGYRTDLVGEDDDETLVITSTAKGTDKRKYPKGKLQLKVLDHINNFLFKFKFETSGVDGPMNPYIKLDTLHKEIAELLKGDDADGKKLVNQSHKISTEARRLISDLTGSPYHCLKKGIDSKGVEFVHNNPN